jgi:hypothetical protein
MATVARQKAPARQAALIADLELIIVDLLGAVTNNYLQR